MMTRSGKRLRVKTAIDGVGEKQSTEKQNFGCEKNPHPELRSTALLLDGLELLVNERCGRSTPRIHTGRDRPPGDPKRNGTAHIKGNVRCGAPGGRALPSSGDASYAGKIKVDIFLS